MKGDSDIIHSARLGRFLNSAATYTSSIDIDSKLSGAVIAVNSAHLIMLTKQGIIDRNSASRLLLSLRKIPENFALSSKLEDVHMNVEERVIRIAGKSIGGMLNIAKSRNDQVSAALRIVLRRNLLQLAKAIMHLQNALLNQALAHVNDIMPGYTHLQRAQPVTLGHHLLAYFDCFDRDFERLIECYTRVNSCPMGAGALAGSSFDLDRGLVSDLLGFDSIVENSLDAVSSRDFATESIYVCAQLMVDLSRIAEEFILWTTKEFSFCEISDSFSSTSSMMPQKKNAIVPEICRARASQVIGDLVGGLSLLKSLPLSYNLDLQELTRNLWSALEKSITSVEIHSEMIKKAKFNRKVMYEAVVADDFIFATELADHLVKEYGIPFREAHGRVAALVRFMSNLKKKRFADNNEKVEEILRVQISAKEISRITDPRKLLSSRNTKGSPNPVLVIRACKERSVIEKRHSHTISTLEDKIERSERKLEHLSESLIHDFDMKTKESTKVKTEQKKVKNGFKRSAMTSVGSIKDLALDDVSTNQEQTAVNTRSKIAVLEVKL